MLRSCNSGNDDQEELRGAWGMISKGSQSFSPQKFLPYQAEPLV